MKSRLPKVLHPIAGLSMLGHVAATVEAAVAGAATGLVIGPHMEGVTAGAARSFVQKDRLGTAHAVLQARPLLEAAEGPILVLYGDTPLIRPETLRRLVSAVTQGPAIAVLGFRAADPTGYGRLLTRDGQLTAIREERDATDEERRIDLCNSGVMAFAPGKALGLLDRIRNDNAKGEFYLTDAVALAVADGESAAIIECGEDEVLGVNTRAQLAEAEAEFQARARRAAMEEGATLVAPDTVFFSHDTKLGRDVVVEPNVVFAPGVVVEDGATIRAFSHLEGAHVSSGATVGPYARLRPGARIGESVHIGNFVEIKAATIERGAKVNHLSYVGDARVGEGANVGAGTITCNYDGFSKHVTDIGAGAFIGSNSALVAPVKIGDGAYVGSGSVITEDVATDALAIGRGRQVAKAGRARELREALGKKKGG
ncbi:N-acetylglucosamine-1-phosphate uridyltransferase [Lutibaculum baratangense AMV1]|uniref:Bifunctional protein GlmU n=2 Tax=Lutibaculum TaxID=1358438 RepID=V4R3P9_9HYPH|nr:N-acetylglucosamine-1-phosphate uridyltransferase [Lutibaculum baratangense AMV1]